MNKIYKYIRLVWDIIINIMFLLKHKSEISSALITLKETKESVKDFNDVKEIQSRFEWTEDKTVDWRPCILVMFMKDLKDDCDGAATLGKWLLKQIGVKSDFYRLSKSISEGHFIVISKDKTKVISNSTIYEISPENWEETTISLCSKQTGVAYTKLTKF